jgi:hypothetical protein
MRAVAGFPLNSGFGHKIKRRNRDSSGRCCPVLVSGLARMGILCAKVHEE